MTGEVEKVEERIIQRKEVRSGRKEVGRGVRDKKLFKER